MSKKPVISKEAQVLLKLLRIALGTEPRKYFEEVVEPFPEGIDWKEVVRLSYEHKVSAIAVDGLEASKYDPYNGLDEKQTEELKAVLVPWIKDVENTEWSYIYYVEVLKTLCEIFRENGLTPIILKGYGLSLNYPRPSHRGAGDIDVFLIDRDGKPAAEKGDAILKEMFGVESEYMFDDVDRHSVFRIKGILIENHYDLLGAEFKSKEDIELRGKLLDELTNNSILQPEGFCLPSSTFNSIFLIQHMAVHLSHGGIYIRQLVDYAYFLKENSTDIDFQTVRSVLHTCRLDTLFDAICTILKDYLGLSDTLCHDTSNDELSNKVMDDMFQKNDRKGIFNVFHYYRERWKIPFSPYNNWLSPTMRSVWIHLFQRKKYKLV